MEICVEDIHRAKTLTINSRKEYKVLQVEDILTMRKTVRMRIFTYNYAIQRNYTHLGKTVRLRKFTYKRHSRRKYLQKALLIGRKYTHGRGGWECLYPQGQYFYPLQDLYSHDKPRP